MLQINRPNKQPLATNMLKIECRIVNEFELKTNWVFDNNAPANFEWSEAILFYNMPFEEIR